MNFGDTKILLTRIALYDNRQVDQAVIQLWSEVLANYTLAEMMWALREHIRFADPGEYLKPAHLIRIVNQKREEFAMMNPLREVNGRDAWLDFENVVAAAAQRVAEIRASGVRYAVDAIESGEYDDAAEG